MFVDAAVFSIEFDAYTTHDIISFSHGETSGMQPYTTIMFEKYDVINRDMMRVYNWQTGLNRCRMVIDGTLVRGSVHSVQISESAALGVKRVSFAEWLKTRRFDMGVFRMLYYRFGYSCQDAIDMAALYARQETVYNTDVTNLQRTPHGEHRRQYKPSDL